MKKTLLYLDEDQMEGSLSLLEVADRIFGMENHAVYTVSLNNKEAITHLNADYRIIIQEKKIKNYDIQNLTDCMEELHRQYKFDCILIPATPAGRLLAPRLSMRLKTGLVADVTDIRRRGEKVVELIRPAFDGKILAGIACQGEGPMMMSVRCGAFSYRLEQKPVKEDRLIVYHPGRYQASGIRLLERNSKPAVKDIRESKILVSGGGGIRENFRMLETLAQALGGMVSASRSIVDSKTAPRAIQVGQSGKTVSPKLYVAIGIYGALQHIEGLKDVEYMISVNTDKDAPICSLSDVVVEGEASEFVDKLVRRITKEYGGNDS